MKPIGAFIGGAKGRLLPLSIPLRFFGAAVVFHLLAWAALAAGALQDQRFAEGLNWPLAALHLVTLGMLGMCALGAGAQLLPVATRQPAIGPRLLAAVWWLYTPGVAVLTLGMGLAHTSLLAVGAAAVVLALLSWALLVAQHLRGALGMPGVVLHGWAALAALLVTLASAIGLLGVWLGWPGLARDTLLGLHRINAAYGFMGLLALGVSYILVPMFALADAADPRRQLRSGLFAVTALGLALIAALDIAALPLRVLALACGAAAVGLHLRMMAQALRSGLRPALGRSFVLIRVSWAGLLASLALGLMLVLQAPVPRLAQWFGLCLIGLWLMSFLLGMLQRILPFLAAMHGGSGRRAHTPSSLSFDPALRGLFACHLAALALLALAFAADSRWPMLAASLVGAVGAMAFAIFYGVLLQRTGKPRG
jgi:hypothetical protein